MKRNVSAKKRKEIPLSEDLSPEIFGDTIESIMYEIVLRLPVDLATRCKQLSKRWCSLITNPDFVKSHFELSTTRDDDALVVHSYDNEDEDHTAVISVINLNSRTRVPGFEFSHVLSDFPAKPILFLVGCDGGIICVYSTLAAHTSKIYLWNPLTKRCKSIPPSSIPSDISVENRVVLGFGYDSVGDDFKVVRVVPPSFSVEVYSANNNAWQNIDSRPNHIPLLEPHRHGNFDVSVNGFLFTAGSHGMITFDLNTQLFNCIKFHAPCFDPTLALFTTHQNPTRITQFQRSVAVIICEKTDYIGKIELWALDDESCFRAGGIEASWTLMFNIDPNWNLQFVHGYFFNTGGFLQLVEEVWYLYNPNKHVLDSYEFEIEHARNFPVGFYTREAFLYRKCLRPIE